MTKALISVFCVVEVGAGLLLVVVPDALTRILFGTTLDTPTSLITARVAGIALLSLLVACWLSRNEVRSAATSGVLAGMLLYNGGVVAALVFAGLGESLIGAGLWPAVAAHALLGVWCIVCVRSA